MSDAVRNQIGFAISDQQLARLDRVARRTKERAPTASPTKNGLAKQAFSLGLALLELQIGIEDHERPIEEDEIELRHAAASLRRNLLSTIVGEDGDTSTGRE